MNNSGTLRYSSKAAAAAARHCLLNYFFLFYDDERLMHCEWNLIEMSQDQLGQGLPCKTTHVLISCAGVHTCNPIRRIPSIIYKLTLSNILIRAHACPARVGLPRWTLAGGATHVRHVSAWDVRSLSDAHRPHSNKWTFPIGSTGRFHTRTRVHRERRAASKRGRSL